ncbi:MAG TPA: hypothetical protein PLD55_11005 [bacterium]|nr:hypothetical protein [bacterium]HPY15085.1 hypothetical protein [bacterium]HQB11305.1 hypothetical protein [bacterium]HQM85195.1 hypothetical protein [bacterium]
MHYFAFLSYEVLKAENYNHDFFNGELEEIGLYSKIKTEGDTLRDLPRYTYIGEYKFADKEELKNVLYSEVKKLFQSNGVQVNLFIGVSEKATIGLDIL